jgi:hypothetical protein
MHVELFSYYETILDERDAPTLACLTCSTAYLMHINPHHSTIIDLLACQCSTNTAIKPILM